MNIQKQISLHRQQLRLKIEQLKIVRKALRRQARGDSESVLLWEASHKAVLNMDRRIQLAERELDYLERTWTF